jgi:hypothetical protein
MSICYFCQHPLDPYIDNTGSGNYQDHQCCYQCPEVENPFRNMEVWKHRCHMIVRANEIKVVYLHFRQLRLWLQVFNFEMYSSPFIDIKDEENKVVLRLQDRAINVFDYTPEALENKIKTWILFS